VILQNSKIVLRNLSVRLANYEGCQTKRFESKEIGSFKKSDVPVFIPKNNATPEMSSRQEGKL